MQALKVPKLVIKSLRYFPRRKRNSLYPETGTASEIIAMSKQNWYGHLDNKKDIDQWLKENYSNADDHINLPRRLEFVNELLRSKNLTGKILELGSGASDMSAFLRAQSDEKNIIFTVSDISLSLIDRFFPKVCDFFDVKIDNFQKIVARGENIPCETNTVNAIVAKSVVHHFESFEKASKETYRVLREKGSFIFINDPIIRFSLLGKNSASIHGRPDDLAFGFNCRSYFFRDYLQLGHCYSKFFVHTDPGLLDYLNLQLIPYWGKHSLRAIAAKLLINFAIGRSFLSISLGVPLIFECVK